MCVSRMLLEVAPPDAEVDPLGLATVLSLGFPLGSRTVYRGVLRANPGARARSTDGELISTGVEPRWTAPPVSANALLELCIEAIRRAIAGVGAKDSPNVALSGGRDSRLIYLGLRSIGVRPRSILTVGSARESPDAHVARALARRHGDPIEHVCGARFDARQERWRHVHQNLESLEHSWFLALALRARALGGPITDGIGAGVLSTGSLMHPDAVPLWKRGALDELADWTIGHAGGTTPEFRAAVRLVGIPLASDDEVRAELVSTLRDLARYPNPLGAFSLLHWTRRGISASAFGLLPSERVVAPLFDEELVSSLLAMDLERAMARDWREVVLERLDQTGIPYADSLMRKPRLRLGSWLGSRAWSRFESECGPDWRPMFDACRSPAGGRRSFSRSALGLLRTLTAR
ncbi:MAG: hypothetical protein LW806_02575 [Planctomycetaceae bacterium]|nr:hypothetical protein [Planctomycetaceae bacterium]